MDKNAKCKIINRSSGIVVYSIPELNIKRTFVPQETKEITLGELEALSFQPGGKELIINFLQVANIEAVEAFTGQKVEPEYLLTPAGVKDLLINGSDDQLLDAFDFGPEAVKDLIKTIAFDIKLNDLNKVKIIKDKTGFDVIAAIRNDEAVKLDQTQIQKEEQMNAAKVNGRGIGETETAATTRRAAPITEKQTTNNSTSDSQRRTTPNYKIINK